MQAASCQYQQPCELPASYVTRVAFQTTSKARPSSVTGTLQAELPL